MKNNKKVIRARSKENGIVFYSNTFPFAGSETFLDDSGNIHSRLISTFEDELNEYLKISHEKETIFNKKNLIIFNIILIIISIIAFVFTENFGLVFAAMFFSHFVSFDLLQFIKASYRMNSKNRKGHSIAQFHAAEHMVINAYDHLQRIPTLEETKQFSRFSKKCGSRFIFSFMYACSMITLSIATLFSYNLLLNLIVVLAIIVFVIIARNYGWLRFLQVFITSKPTEKEIELAIEGLKQFEIMEKKFDNEKMSFMMKNYQRTFYS